MTDDLMYFINWLFAAAWDILSSVKVPGFKNVTFAHLFIALFIVSLSFGILSLIGVVGSKGGNSRRKAKEDNDD